MNKRRIIYFLKPHSFPAGGVAAIYRHVEILHTHGMPAFVALRKRPRIDFYQSKAPLLIYGSSILRSHRKLRRHVRHGDVWVIPEVYPDILQALVCTPAKRILFCQNHFLLRFTSNPKAGVAEFGAHEVVVSTEASRDFFCEAYGLDVPFLQSYAIDRTLFAPSGDKKRQIAFMPRKLPQEAIFIQAVFKRHHPQYADVPWITIDNLPHADVARILRESAVFLSLSFMDALGLPPLEAMSSECLVAGYHGEGGRTYMTAENGWWADTGNWKSCVDGLAAALDLFDRGGAELDARRRAMADRAKTIRIETGRNGSESVCVSVEDAGCGIEPAQFDRIFDVFVTMKKDGMGLGLPLCQLITDHHGGHISVVSEPGNGARFEIALPVGSRLQQ